MHHQEHPFPFVLIVDGDTISTLLTKYILLEQNLARKVLTLHSAEDALAFVTWFCFNPAQQGDGCPDLILLELELSEMDGFEFLEVLREWGYSRLIEERVVVLTSSAQKRERTRVEALKVHHFLAKPLTAGSFHALLEERYPPS
jgi:CheY-like chemotaxis protein